MTLVQVTRKSILNIPGTGTIYRHIHYILVVCYNFKVRILLPPKSGSGRIPTFPLADPDPYHLLNQTQERNFCFPTNTWI